MAEEKKECIPSREICRNIIIAFNALLFLAAGLLMAIARHAPNWTQIEPAIVDDELQCAYFSTVKNCLDCNQGSEKARMARIENRTDICPLSLKREEWKVLGKGRAHRKTLKWEAAYYRPFAFAFIGPLKSLAIENFTDNSVASTYTTANVSKGTDIMRGIQSASQLKYALEAATSNYNKNRGICTELTRQGTELHGRCFDYPGWFQTKCQVVQLLCTDVNVQVSCLICSPVFSFLACLMLLTMIVDTSRVCKCLGDHQTTIELAANLEYRRRRFLVMTQLFGLVAILTGIPTWHSWLGGVHQQYAEAYAMLAENNGTPPYAIGVGPGYWFAVGGWMMSVLGVVFALNLLHAPRAEDEVGCHKLKHKLDVIEAKMQAEDFYARKEKPLLIFVFIRWPKGAKCCAAVPCPGAGSCGFVILNKKFAHLVVVGLLALGMYVSVFEPYSAETEAWFFRSEAFKMLCVNAMAGTVALMLVGVHHERQWNHAADEEKLRLVQYYNKPQNKDEFEDMEEEHDDIQQASQLQHGNAAERMFDELTSMVPTDMGGLGGMGSMGGMRGMGESAMGLTGFESVMERKKSGKSKREKSDLESGGATGSEEKEEDEEDEVDEVDEDDDGFEHLSALTGRPLEGAALAAARAKRKKRLLKKEAKKARRLAEERRREEGSEGEEEEEVAEKLDEFLSDRRQGGEGEEEDEEALETHKEKRQRIAAASSQQAPGN
jgi:hypothetical protein